MDFDELIKSKKVLICCGSGGVGKTTLSAAIGVKAAQMGLRVLVLTIDPARRLANSLGLNNLSGEEVRVGEKLFKGELYAAVLDSKKIFDSFVTKLSPSPEVAEKILQNGIYQQLSTALSASQEYTALERLLQVSSMEKFDLVILDTPPTKHAIDFLNAPAKVYSLFQEAIIKWFFMPFSTIDKMSLGLMNRGTRAAFKAFEKIVGSEFLTMITEFFMAIKDLQYVLKERSAEVHRLLISDKTGFVLVTGFHAVRIEEARYFERNLKNGGYHLSAIIVNRTFPLWGHHEDSTEGNIKGNAAYQKLRDYYNELKEFYREQHEAFKQFAGEYRQNVAFLSLPDFDQDIHDLDSLKKLADRIEYEKKPVAGDINV